MDQLFLISSPLPTPPMNEFGAWMVSLFCFVGCVAFIFKAWNEGKKTFGRKPPIDEDLQRYSASVDKLKLDLAKLPDEEKFNKLADQLRGFATLPQLAALEIAFDRQAKDVRSYAHDQIHTLRGELTPRLMEIEEAAVLRGELLAKLDERTQNQGRVIGGFSEKLDRVVDRMTDKFLEILRKEKNGQH